MGAELFSMVASQYGLHEKEYFGLTYTATNNDQYAIVTYHAFTRFVTFLPVRADFQDWLDLTRSVKEQFPKAKQLPLLTFAVRYTTHALSPLQKVPNYAYLLGFTCRMSGILKNWPHSACSSSMRCAWFHPVGWSVAAREL
jgi:hypothetical protein